MEKPREASDLHSLITATKQHNCLGDVGAVDSQTGSTLKNHQNEIFAAIITSSLQNNIWIRWNCFGRKCCGQRKSNYSVFATVTSLGVGWGGMKLWVCLAVSGRKTLLNAGNSVFQ